MPTKSPAAPVRRRTGAPKNVAKPAAAKVSKSRTPRLLPFENPLVRVGRSTIHGMGLFAATRIKKGARIGQMEGVERKRSNDHVLWIEEDDGRVWGLEGLNEFRFTNHSDEPNAVFYGAELFALRTIEAGEEITFDYGGEVVPAD